MTGYINHNSITRSLADEHNVSDTHAVSISSTAETLEDAGGSKITLTAARTSILTQYC